VIKNINKIVIIGGGSAGWMSATTICRVFPDKEVLVIESKNSPTVGVGESTLGFLNDWLFLVGLKKEDFMSECDATYKLSIKFTDFLEKDSGPFHYPFGLPVFNPDRVFGGTEKWYIKKMIFPETPISDYANTYYPSMSLVNNNKFTDKITLNGLTIFDHNTDSAVHFDAAMFGLWLKNNICLKNGVEVINADVIDFSETENGISSVLLDNGENISADLFIDCTGFKSLLLGNFLKEKFIDYSELLPNNRAWATRIPYSNKEKELEPFTSCTAIGNGWVWNIPSWKRIGTGYVYSDKYISPENALKEFKNYLRSEKMTVEDPDRDVESFEYKDIKMRVGIHERTFVKNVVAIGLSAGFIEPLESSGLYTVHQFLISLCQLIERGQISQWDIDAYNMINFQQFNAFADFVAMHYALSLRNDTEYWQDVTSKTFYPEMINEKFTNHRTPIDLAIRKFHSNSWSEIDSRNGASAGLNCVATGLNYFPLSATSAYLKYSRYGIDIEKEALRYLEETDLIKKEWDDLSKDSRSLLQYLSEEIYNENK
jgi:flavin-dependent dehydrogenase